MDTNGLIGRFKKKLGPLAWHSLVLFCIWRIGDAANILNKFVLGKLLPNLDFGALEPILSVIALAGLPLLVVYRVSAKSMSRLLEMGRRDECAALVRDLMKLVVAWSVISLIAVFVFHRSLLAWLHLEGNAYVFLLAAMSVLAWWEPLALGVIQGSRKFSLTMVPTVFTPLSILALTVLFVGLLKLELRGALLARVLAATVAVLLVFTLSRQVMSAPTGSYRSEHTTMKKMLLPMVVFLVSMAPLMHLDRLLVRPYLVEESGGYAAVITLGQVPLWLIGPLTFVVFPLAAAEHAGGRDVSRYRNEALAIGSIITLVSVVGFRLFAPDVMALWNTAFVPYSAYVWMYALSAGMYAVTEILASIEMARNRYAFLWALVLPALALTVGLLSLRDSLSIPLVLLAIALARGAALLGVFVVSAIVDRQPA